MNASIQILLRLRVAYFLLDIMSYELEVIRELVFAKICSYIGTPILITW